MVLRNWILAMLLIAASSRGLGQSRLYSADVKKTPNAYEALGFSLFDGETEDYIAAGKDRLNVLNSNQNQSPVFLQQKTKSVKVVKRALEILSDPHSRFLYNVELVEELLTQPNIYFAFNVRPWSEPSDFQTVIELVKYRFKNPPPGIEDEYLERGRVASRQVEVRVGALLDPVKKENIEKQISRQNPLTSKMNGLEKTGWWANNFAMGTMGFMAGNWAYLQLKCHTLGDPAICWSAADQLNDSSTKWGLAAFGLGAEATSRIYHRFVPMNQTTAKFASAPGMVVGSLVNQFTTKFFGSKFHKIAWNNMKEHWLELHEWGNVSHKRSELEIKINDLERNITFLPKEKLAEKKSLQNQLNIIKAQQIEVDAKCKKYRDAWASALAKSASEVATFEQGEFENLSISTLRMIAASMAVAEFNAITRGLWAESKVKSQNWYYMSGPRREFLREQSLKAMSNAERAEFIENEAQIAKLKHFEKNFVDRFRSNPQLKAALLERNEAKFNALRKFFEKSVREKADAIIVDGNWFQSLKQRSKDFWGEKLPDVSNVQVSASLGRRVLLRGIVPQLIFAGINAIEFLGTDDLIRIASTRAYHGSLLQARSESHISDMANAIAGSQQSNDPKFIDNFLKGLTGYEQLWQNYRDQVITGDTTQSVRNWDSERDKHRRKLDYESQWLSWFARSKDINHPDFSDKIFQKNNLRYDPNKADDQQILEDLTGDEEWHTDPVATPDIFKEEMAHYLKIVSPLTPEKMKAYLDAENFKENNWEYSNAKDMDSKLRPLLMKEYFGEALPSYVRFTDAAAEFSLRLGNALINYTKAFFSLPQAYVNKTFDSAFDEFYRDLSKNKWPLPSNWAQSYVSQIYYMTTFCNQVTPTLLPTTLVLNTQSACKAEIELLMSSPSAALKVNPFDKLLQTKEFAALIVQMKQPGGAQELLHSDIVAAKLAISIDNTINGMIFLYTKQVNNLLSQPKSAEEARLLDNKKSAEAAKAALESALQKDDEEFKKQPQP